MKNLTDEEKVELKERVSLTDEEKTEFKGNRKFSKGKKDKVVEN